MAPSDRNGCGLTNFVTNLVILYIILCLKDCTLGNCQDLPIDRVWQLPAPLPAWPPGDGFASGTIDLGGLQVCQVTTFIKVWETHDGGPDNLGASFYEPSPIPPGFVMLGYYSQPNNQPVYGWVLAGKDVIGGALQQPIDYTLVWSSESWGVEQYGVSYFWLPTPPDGYKAVGHVVTNFPMKPPLDNIWCVRADFTDVLENGAWIYSSGDGLNVYASRPSVRGTQALGVSAGTFVAQVNDTAPALATLKNSNANLCAMPNLAQIQTIFQAYSPYIYFHPHEEYLPSSVSWYFTQSLLYTKGNEANPVPIDPLGSTLPQGGTNDGAFWIDLPIDDGAKDTVKAGDLSDAGVYLHVKPMLGGTFTDIALWIFYPFNGPGAARLEIVTIPLGKIGQHVGDWEHVTLRVSNFNGELRSVYFSEHSGGVWVNSYDIEYENPQANRFVVYSSLHGHGSYPKAGENLMGKDGIGLANECDRSDKVLDSGAKYVVVAAEHLGSAIVEPPWLNYARQWGPTIDYNLDEELENIAKLLIGDLKKAFEKLIDSLPKEIFGEEGPTGPKWKDNWSGDERE